ncbi:MAG: TetR/AcrR family transcriptional regulator [Gallionellaceae bacterium]|nr:TetR/AcrR family transcriptional regulator [Gallionellaceae bacterium]
MTRASQRRETREDILAASVPLFASYGYEGVSMRQIAAEVGVQPAALYYYFPDKQKLHLAVMEFALKGITTGATARLHEAKPPLARLNNFCVAMIDALSANPELLPLLQRERLTDDHDRTKLLYEEVFAKPFEALVDTVKEMKPDQDPLLLAISVLGLVNFYLELKRVRRFMPGWRSEHEWPETLSLHVTGLLKKIFAEEEDGC